MTESVVPTAHELGIGRFFEHVGDAVVVADTTTGAIVLWNPVAAQVFGYTAEEAVRIHIEQIIPGVCAHCPSQGGTTEATGVVQLPAVRKDGELITVELSMNLLAEAPLGRRFALSIIRDVTERKRMEEAVRFQKSLLESQTEASIDGILVVATDGRILSFNRRFVEMWGIPQEIVDSRSDDAALKWALGQLTDPQEFIERVTHLYAHPQERSRDEIRLKNGQVLDRYSAPVNDAEGVNYGRVWYFRDVTERAELLAQADQRAREIEALYHQAQQAAVLEERQRLARDLHDAVTQTLFSASLVAEVVPRLWDRDQEEARKRMEEVRQLTRGALAEMRSLLLELRPDALTNIALTDLLKQLGDAFQGRARIPVALTVDGDRAFTSDVQIAFYRIAQEAFNNIAKHAHASRVEVRLFCRDEAVSMEIRDDGRGFAQAVVPPGHMGLGNMRERASSIGAALSITSAPKRGTSVLVSWSPRP